MRETAGERESTREIAWLKEARLSRERVQTVPVSLLLLLDQTERNLQSQQPIDLFNLAHLYRNQIDIYKLRRKASHPQSKSAERIRGGSCLEG